MILKVFKDDKDCLTLVESEDNLKLVAMQDFKLKEVGEIDTCKYKNMDYAVAAAIEIFGPK